MECSICLEAIEEDSTPTLNTHSLQCGHTFHTDCIVRSLRSNSACPVCRDDPYKAPPPNEAQTNQTANQEVRLDLEYTRWMRRRSRLARTNQDIGHIRQCFIEAQKNLRVEQSTLRRMQLNAFRRPDIVEQRRHHAVAQRQYVYERERYDRIVESFIGPRPANALVIEIIE